MISPPALCMRPAPERPRLGCPPASRWSGVVAAAVIPGKRVNDVDGVEQTFSAGVATVAAAQAQEISLMLPSTATPPAPRISPCSAASRAGSQGHRPACLDFGPDPNPPTSLPVQRQRAEHGPAGGMTGTPPRVVKGHAKRPSGTRVPRGRYHALTENVCVMRRVQFDRQTSLTEISRCTRPARPEAAYPQDGRRQTHAACAHGGAAFDAVIYDGCVIADRDGARAAARTHRRGRSKIRVHAPRHPCAHARCQSCTVSHAAE